MAMLNVQTQRSLQAEALQKWCTEAKDDVVLTARRIVGPLDLRRVHLQHALRFVDCEFEAINLTDARAEEPIEWQGGKIAAIAADRFESKAYVAVSNVAVSGPISLHWANLQGDLRFTDSQLQESHGPALNGRDLRVNGGLFLDGESFRAEGEVCLSSAHIKQSLDCRHATFDNPSGCSIKADELSAGGELLLEDDFTARGEVNLERATISRLRAAGGTFDSGHGNGNYALRGDALCARSGVFLDHGFHAFGEVSLVGADITGQLCCTNGHFDNPAGAALDARRLQAEDVYLDRGFRAAGEVRLDGALLIRQLNCTNGEFANERGIALDCDDMQCDGDVFLDRGFIAKGEVRLVGAQIKNELNCTGGRFENQAGKALNADGLTTPGNAFLNTEPDAEFHAIGEVRLARATIGRQLVLSGAVLTTNANTLALDLTGLVCPGDVLLNEKFRTSGEVRLRGAHIARDLDFTGSQLRGDPLALDAQGARVGGSLRWRLSKKPEGRVDLSSATVNQLDDNLTEWPEKKFVLAGFTCQTPPTESTLGVEQVVAWLRESESHYSDAYQQMGTAYRMKGNEDAARDIAIARQRDLRKRGKLTKSAKVWNWILDQSSSYGYRLNRPLYALLGLAVIGTIIFIIADAHGLMEYRTTPHIPVFQPFVYSVQLVVPLVDLQEVQVWMPKTGTLAGNLLMTYVWIAIALGWLLSGALVAGIGRLWRQGDR
jgi:hypothetical protein